MARAKQPRGVDNPPKMPAALDAAVRLGLTSKSLMRQHQAIKECIEGLYGVNQRTVNNAVFKDYLDQELDKIKDSVDTPTNRNYRTVTQDADVLTSDNWLRIDASQNDVTITMPNVVSSKGKQFFFKRMDSSTNTVKVKGKSTAKIDFEAFEELKDQGSFLAVESDGTRWLVFGRSGVTKETEESIRRQECLLENITSLLGVLNTIMSLTTEAEVSTEDIKQEYDYVS